jgi:hypothetical protein
MDKLERKRNARVKRAKVIVTAARALAAEKAQPTAELYTSRPTVPHRRRLARILSAQSRLAPS